MAVVRLLKFWLCFPNDAEMEKEIFAFFAAWREIPVLLHKSSSRAKAQSRKGNAKSEAFLFNQ